MNILNLSTNDTFGAGKTTYLLHKNFKIQGHNSKLLVLNKTINDDDIIRFNSSKVRKIYDKIAKRIIVRKRTDPKYYFYNYSEKYSYYPTRQLLKHIAFTPDVIIVGWISCFINTKNLFELNKITKAPVFWHGMDMAPLTGGCHYAGDCEGYKKKCGNCPAIYSQKKNDISSRNFIYKLNYINKTNLSLITASTGFRRQTDQSALFANKNKTNILSAIDNEIFKPLEKSLARKIFGIPTDKKIILIGAISLNETRKGVKYLSESLTILENKLSAEERENIFLLIIGNVDSHNRINLPFTASYTGFLNDDRLLALSYQAADVFVCSSIEDGGPIMINESIMCGTPVVAFDMGVAPDLVHTGKTGYLAILMDTNDFAKGIKEIISLNKESYRTMSENCRELGLKLLHPKKQINDFEKLFNSVI